MDTRSKILTVEEARKLAGPLAIATGTFNPLLAADARELAAFRERIGSARLLVIVLPAEPELLAEDARAELVAALRAVDHVVAAEAETAFADLCPVAVAHLRDHTQELMEHVRRVSGRS